MNFALCIFYIKYKFALRISNLTTCIFLIPDFKDALGLCQRCVVNNTGALLVLNNKHLKHFIIISCFKANFAEYMEGLELYVNTIVIDYHECADIKK